MGRLSRHKFNAFALLGLSLLVVGCKTGSAIPVVPAEATPIAQIRPAVLPADGKLHVVATTQMVADVVRTVGGDAVVVTSLLAVGADPHTYEPTPEDLRTVAAAQVVFENGLGLEGALIKVLDAAGEGAVTVSLSEGLVPRSWAATPSAGPAGADPHVWFDPTYVSAWADNAARALAALDPPQAASFRANADSYRERLSDLDQWIKTQAAAIPEGKRELVTDHDELGYFAARYGFQIVGAVIPSYSTTAEPSAQEISQIETAIRQLGVKAVFVGTSVNPTLSRRVTQDTGTRLVPLYTESLSAPGGPAGDYISLMKYDVQAIVDALR